MASKANKKVVPTKSISNASYLEYGKQAVEAFKSGELCDKVAGALTVYALVMAHQQATLPNNLTIEGYADIDGKAERKRMGAWYDAVLEDVFGISPAHATAADQKRIRHHMPVVLNVIGNKDVDGIYPCRLNSVTGCLVVEGFLVVPSDETLHDKELEIDGSKYSMAKLITTSKKSLGMQSTPKPHHKAKPSVVEAVSGRDAEGIAQATKREDVMPKAMKVIADSLCGLDKADLTKETISAAQELLVTLIGIFGQQTSIELYREDAA